MFSFIGNLFKKNTRTATESDVEGQRYNDGVLLIQQDNLSKKILIQASNLNCQKLLGYDNNEIMGRDLRELLTDSESAAINDFTEFEDGKKDFAEVISKMRYFKMLTKSGEYLPLRLRLVRSISQQNKPSFQLIFNDDIIRESLEKERAQLRQNLRGDEIFDDLTGLLSQESVLKDIEILSFYEGKRENGSVLVIFRITNFNELSLKLEPADISFMKVCLAQAIESCKREEDISAKVGNDDFLLILVETPLVNISTPANRVKTKFEQLIAERSLAIKPELEFRYRKVDAEMEAEKQISILLA